MLIMVIERFKDTAAIRARMLEQGRMMPEGVRYVDSWIEEAGVSAPGPRCFQLMEAESPAALQPWIDRWSDLMEFELRPVLQSKDFWAAYERR